MPLIRAPIFICALYYPVSERKFFIVYIVKKSKLFTFLLKIILNILINMLTFVYGVLLALPIPNYAFWHVPLKRVPMRFKYVLTVFRFRATLVADLMYLIIQV